MFFMRLAWRRGSHSDIALTKRLSGRLKILYQSPCMDLMKRISGAHYSSVLLILRNSGAPERKVSTFVIEAIRIVWIADGSLTLTSLWLIRTNVPFFQKKKPISSPWESANDYAGTEINKNIKYSPCFLCRAITSSSVCPSMMW
jgi:hypothetical protein